MHLPRSGHSLVDGEEQVREDHGPECGQIWAGRACPFGELALWAQSWQPSLHVRSRQVGPVIRGGLDLEEGIGVGIFHGQSGAEIKQRDIQGFETKHFGTTRSITVSPAWTMTERGRGRKASAERGGAERGLGHATL